MHSDGPYGKTCTTPSPYGLAFEGFADGHRLGDRRGAVVHALDSFRKLVDFNFDHVSRISWADGGGHAIYGEPDDVLA